MVDLLPALLSSDEAPGYTASDGDALGVTDRICVAPTAVLRMAAFPWSHLAPFDGGHLPAAAAAVEEADARARASADLVVEHVHGLVPAATPDGRRRWLAVRRAAMAGRRLPEAFADTAGGLQARLDQYEHDRSAADDAATAYAAAHARTLAAERAGVRRLAQGDDFRRALAVANPSVAAQWDAVRSRPADDRSRTRRLELTLWRYLVRGVTRPLPQGAWAGVVPVTGPRRDGSDDSSRDTGPVTLEDATAAYTAVPDLDVLALVAARRATRPAYRHAPLRLEPSIELHGGAWRILGSGDDGAQWTALGQGEPLDTLFSHWADGEARTATDAVARLAALGMPLEAGWHLIDDALANGILLPTADLDPAATDAWTALGGAADGFVPDDRAHWVAAMATLRELCLALEERFDELAPEEVATHLVEAQETVQRLWEWAGLEGTAPSPVLHLDRRLPFRATWRPGGHAVASATVREVLAFHTADGAAERYRKAATARIRGAVEQLTASLPDGVPPFELLAAAGRRAKKAPASDRFDVLTTRLEPDDEQLAADVAAHVRSWERRIYGRETVGADDVARRVDPAELGPPSGRPGPGGTLIVAVGPEGRAWAPWGRPQPALLVGRHHRLLGAASPAGALNALAARWAARGIVAAEVVGRDPENRTVSVRPVTTLSRLDPLGTEGTRLASLRLHVSGDDVVVTDGDGRRLLPLYGSVAIIGGRDPGSLLLRTLAMAHGWEWVAMGMPVLPAEEDGRGRPALVLRDGTVLAPRRWVLPAGSMDPLLDAPDAATRYRVWHGLATQHGWPPVIDVRWDENPNMPALAVLTRSPLAVEALAERLPRGARLVVVAAPGPDGGVAVPGGERHAAELAVVWCDESWPGPAMP